MTDKEVQHMIATQLLGWGFARRSDTYWIDIGVEVGMASSFNPLTDEYQGNKVITDLELPCTLENLREYVLSLTDYEKAEIRKKYNPKKLAEAGIKMYTVGPGGTLQEV